MSLRSLKSRLSLIGEDNKGLRLMTKFAARETGVSVDDLRGPTRRRDVYLVRQAVMIEARNAGFTTTQIGRFFNRDHSSICHATKGKQA